MLITLICTTFILSIIFVAILLYEGMYVVKVFNYSPIVIFSVMGISAMLLIILFIMGRLVWLSATGGI